MAAEDTRHTRKLFSHFDIHTPLTSYHEHNKRSKGQFLVEKLEAGESIALVTDAGLPGVSDPGEDLASLALSRGITVVPVPGASASLAALVVSGLPAARFCFEGFLPARGKLRRQRLEELKTENRTLIFYEAPHRLVETLSHFQASFGDIRVCVARELTKLHEEVWRGTLSEAVAKFGEHPPRGEVTLVLEGPGTATKPVAGEEPGADEIAELVLSLESSGLSRRDAVREISEKKGLPKNIVYAAVLKKNEG